MNQQQRSNLLSKVRTLAQQHDAVVKTDKSNTQITIEHRDRKCDVLLPTTYATGILVRWEGMETHPDLFGPLGQRRLDKQDQLIKTLDSQIQFLSNPTLH